MRQYIGARYVPRFSEVNGGNWSDVYAYEPLIIVKHGNDYYTAKQAVPVGIQITNTDYWVQTGNYNGAITELQNDINDMKDGSISGSLQNQINNIKNRTFMLFGDSYSVGIDGDNNTQTVSGGGWAVRFKALMEGYGATVYYRPGQSNGIATPTPILPDFNSQIASMTDDEKRAITDVIYIGGWNDQWIAEATVRSAMEVFCNRVREVIPHARILIAPYTISPIISNENIVPRYRVCQKYGAEFNLNLINLLAQKSLSGIDNIHPTAGGYNMAQAYITSVILTGICHYSTGLMNRTYTDANGESIVFNCFANEKSIRFSPVGTQRGYYVLNVTTSSGTKNFACTDADYIKLPLTYFIKHACSWYRNGSFIDSLGLYPTDEKTLALYYASQIADGKVVIPELEYSTSVQSF